VHVEVSDIYDQKVRDVLERGESVGGDGRKYKIENPENIFHTRLVEAGVCDIPDNKNIIVWAEVFVGVKDGIDIDKELAGEDYEPGHVEPKPKPESKLGHFGTDPVTGKTKFVSPKRKNKIDFISRTRIDTNYEDNSIYVQLSAEKDARE
jgi:hypothetical protein